MGFDMSGLLVALASFALTFFVARVIGRRLKARSEKTQAAQAAQQLARQSRQVRRAQQRKNTR